MNATSPTYWRMHWAASGQFGADNAYSFPWSNIVVRNPADPTQHTCMECWGQPSTVDGPCPVCDGTGWQDARRGYSCLTSADELADYMREWLPEMIADPESVAGEVAAVVEFEGVLTGRGDTDEYLVVPRKVVQTMSLPEFVARHCRS